MNYTTINSNDLKRVTPELLAFPTYLSESDLDIDRGRSVCVSRWCPKVQRDEAVMVEISGQLWKGPDEPVTWLNWKLGDTEPAMEMISLQDGRKLRCRDWKVDPGSNIYITMTCYFMREKDREKNFEEFTD